jgi:hypothetical protein
MTFRIPVKRATRAVRGARTLPYPQLEADDERPVPEERFQGSDSQSAAEPW